MKKMLASIALISAIPASVFAGNIYLTGHDVDLHDGQNGYDNVIVDYLRDGRTAPTYSIAVIGSGIGYWGWTDVPGFGDRGSKPGYGATTFYDTDTMNEADWDAALSHSLLEITSFVTCGGCDLDGNGVDVINAHSSKIQSAFNAGMDIWGNSAATSATYYNFLPPSAVATGAPIDGSSGFTATPAGVGIGILPTQINGFPTHNRFASSASVFTVMETRGEEIISLGLKGGRIACPEGTTPPDCTPIIIITPAVPEPSTFGLMGLGLALVGFIGRRRKK